MHLANELAALLFVGCMSIVSGQRAPVPVATTSTSTGKNARPAINIPPPSFSEGPNFDQERLVALFGSEAQPVYGNRDPNTGRVVMLETQQQPFGNGQSERFASVRASHRPSSSSEEMEESSAENGEPIDRKDTRVPETNEINPFELLPPQFHDLLNIPIHDYGNGTTYNPYDKYKVPSKNKYPLVSTGYANTKYQGRNTTSTTTTKKPLATKSKPVGDGGDYDYDDVEPVKASKSTRRPTLRPKTTTTAEPQYERERATTTKKYRQRPTTRPPPSAKVPVQSRPYDDPADIDYADVDQVPAYSPKPKPNYQPTPLRKPQPAYETATKDEYGDTFGSERPHYDDEDEFKRFQQQSQQRPYNREEAKPYHKPRPHHSPSYEHAYQQPVYTSDDQVAEIRVTPKPFYAADGSLSFQPSSPQQQGVRGQVVEDELPDIIYDYDDERSKGEGVLFLVDKGVSTSSSSGGSVGAPAITPSATPSPIIRPYPTVANRERPIAQANPALPPFRPSAPIRQSAAEPALSAPQQLPGLSPPPLPGSFNEVPRPPFQFSQQPTLEQLAKENQQKQAPNIFPLFRPNANPTDEFQFIKHPQQIEFQRQQPQQIPQRPDHVPQRLRPLGGMNPLPSALQSPFSSISQAVANFFGRRSSTGAGVQRSGDLDSQPADDQTKQDRFGIVDRSSDADMDLDMSESRSFALAPPDLEQPQGYSGRELDQGPPPRQPVSVFPPHRPGPRFPIAVPRPHEAIDRSDQPLVPQPQPVIDPSFTAQSKQVIGIRANPAAVDNKPPAFYVYTSRELEEGKPPYLVVGPVLSGPPNVAGAQLVHTAPAQQMNPRANPLTAPPSPDSQRRSDTPTEGVRPLSPNALPSFPGHHLPAGGAPIAPLVPHQQPQEVSHLSPPPPPIRKPFFPISPPPPPAQSVGSGNVHRPPNGLAPPRQSPPPQLRPPGFSFPEGDPELVPIQGIAPTSEGIPPPRVPLNPAKDIASLNSNPTLLHTRPAGVGEEVGDEDSSAEASIQHHTQHQSSIFNIPARPVEKPGLSIDSALPLRVVGSASQPAPTRPAPPTTPKPLRRPKPTKTPSVSTTPASIPFNYQPVTYATIQQEDGKQIAVVHPAYVVTYKSFVPGNHNLESLDAPFIPSVESHSSADGEMSSIPFEKWHSVPLHEQDSNASASDSHPVVSKPGNSGGFKISEGFQSGFVPIVPGQH